MQEETEQKKAPSAPPWDRWLDRDTNGCLNLQRVGESMQRPLELSSYEGLEALPTVGTEYQQGYKRVNDRLPKDRPEQKAAREPSVRTRDRIERVSRVFKGPVMLVEGHEVAEVVDTGKLTVTVAVPVWVVLVAALGLVAGLAMF
ncbi:hypothetical protein HaLaN_22714, partial [Haematococcus lacustris]